MWWQLFLIATLLWLLFGLRNKNGMIVSKQVKSDLITLPFIGNGYMFIGDTEDIMKALKRLGRQAIKHAGVSGFWLVNLYLCVIADPVLADAVLKAPTCLEKHENLKFMRVLTGNGSIFAEVPIWRPRRKTLAPTFSMKNLNQFVSIFSEQSAVMVDLLHNHAINNTSFSIFKFITSYTMDSVCETSLGTKLGSQKEKNNPFPNYLEDITESVAKRLFTPLLHEDFIYKYTRDYRETKKRVKSITEFVLNIIKEKRKDLAQRKLDKNKNNLHENSEKLGLKSFLELLIESSGGDKGYSDLELQEETMVLVLAGTDTSAVGASFTTLLMAKYPNVQEKVYQELKEVFGDSDRPLLAEDLPRLKYLDAVIKESLRLFPPVPIIAREAEKEITLPSDLKILPGVGMVINMWAIHRNPKYWGEDAELFRPERFFDRPPTHPVAFIPFSHGPRQCLGYQYAMMSMKTVLASLIRKYEVLPAPYMAENKYQSLRLKYNIMLKHADNFEIKLRIRK